MCDFFLLYLLVKFLVRYVSYGSVQETWLIVLTLLISRHVGISWWARYNSNDKFRL